MNADWPAGLTTPPLPLFRTVDALGVLTGAQLFSLQKEELRAVSPEEGARVYSQITVHRALLEVSGGRSSPGRNGVRRGLGRTGPDFHLSSRTKRKCQSWRR